MTNFVGVGVINGNIRNDRQGTMVYDNLVMTVPVPEPMSATMLL